MELFKQAFKDTKLILENEIVSWLDAVEVGNERANISLVLMMLHNVQSLDLSHLYDYKADVLLYHRIKCITKCQYTKALSRVTEVRLLPGDFRSQNRFNWFRTFAKLQSVKAIEAWDIDPHGDCFDYDYTNDRCITDCYGLDENHDSYHTVYHESR